MSNAARNWNLVWKVSGSEFRTVKTAQAPFPLTPKERENYRPRGDKAKHPDISLDDRQSTLSLGRGLG